MSVVIETTLGDITVDLFVEERPQTCLNFLKLCKLKYYNLNLFHSVNANFCAQTGDPTGKGDGGESIHGLLKGSEFRFYQAERQPKIKHDSTGLISMVSHGKGMLGSQFIITLGPDLGSLDGEHCVFGKVVEGSEVLLKLNEAIADEQHRPYQDIRVTHTVVLEDPFPDPPGMLTPPPSPLPPSTKDVAYSRIPADEPLSESHTQEELNEMVQAREAAARATILEMVGDLPDADVAPPENVLFVCKLNPVTSDHDLSLIFSRFGKVKNCEVIRDSVTGESLQYAFVEFEDKKSCEEAYFKMDNVLIDERRIHVDFSQSVAKWRGKGRGVEMLVPPPAGGWGSRKNHKTNFPRRDENSPQRKGNAERREDSSKLPVKKQDSRPVKNGLKNGERAKSKAIVKKEISKKKRRASPTSSSSSSDTSSSSSSTSSSDSSDSEPVKKKSRSRKTEKVLVVVKTPRNKKSKKNKRVTKKRKHRSESDSDMRKRKNKKVKRRRVSSVSSEDSIPHKKRSKKRASDKIVKRKASSKRTTSSSDSSSEDSSDEEAAQKAAKKRIKKRRKCDDASETDRPKSRKKRKSERKRRRSTSDSDDSDSD